MLGLGKRRSEEHRCCVPLELGKEPVWRKGRGKRSGRGEQVCSLYPWARAGALANFGFCFVERALSVSELPASISISPTQLFKPLVTKHSSSC